MSWTTPDDNPQDPYLYVTDDVIVKNGFEVRKLKGKNKRDFIDSAVQYDVMPISQNNYRQIIRARSVEGYKAFFDNNY